MQNREEVLENLDSRGMISARIIDFESEIRELHGVYAIRIHSKHSKLLIMNNHMPTIGRIEGDVSILNAEGETAFKSIRGFYKHQRNEFLLLIEARFSAEENKE